MELAENRDMGHGTTRHHKISQTNCLFWVLSVLTLKLVKALRAAIGDLPRVLSGH